MPDQGRGPSHQGRRVHHRNQSVNSDSPSPALLPYDVTKAGIANMTAALAQLLAPRGIRANSVAPGPIWTPLIPSAMPPEYVEDFGSSSALKRPGHPAEVAPVYVLLASDQASYVHSSSSASLAQGAASRARRGKPLDGVYAPFTGEAVADAEGEDAGSGE